jgi:hypothetical protein
MLEKIIPSMLRPSEVPKILHLQAPFNAQKHIHIVADVINIKIDICINFLKTLLAVSLFIQKYNVANKYNKKVDVPNSVKDIISSAEP